MHMHVQLNVGYIYVHVHVRTFTIYAYSLQAIFFAGLDPHLRPEMWPFLLYYYPYTSTYEEREHLRNDKYIVFHDIRKKRYICIYTCMYNVQEKLCVLMYCLCQFNFSLLVMFLFDTENLWMLRSQNSSGAVYSVQQKRMLYARTAATLTSKERTTPTLKYSSKNMSPNF